MRPNLERAAWDVRFERGNEYRLGESGIDNDTAEFAVNAIRRWHRWASVRYPKADGC